MEYRLFDSQQLNQFRDLWNKEMPHQFHLEKDLFQSQIIDSIDLDLASCFVVLEDNVIVGGILVKRWNRKENALYKNTAWISMIYVKKAYQGRLIGSTLIDQALLYLKGKGVQKVHIGKDMNNLFCGVPAVFDSVAFFEKNVFRYTGIESDMHVSTSTISPLTLRRKTDYQARVSTKDDFNKIEQFFQKSFPGRWTQEFQEYREKGGAGEEFVIFEKDDKVVAFCRANHSRVSQNMYNTNWRSNFDNLYGVGPLGVDPDYRDYSLGYDITAYAINYAIEQGATDIIIDWTTLVSFYQKFGCTVWHTYHTFVKELTE